MRPKKIRTVKCDTNSRYFMPKTDKPLQEAIVLSLDEFEAIRLLDQQGLSQEATASLMKVHRSTISRIITSARHKIAQALVNIQPINIEGGCCQVIPPSKVRKIK